LFGKPLGKCLPGRMRSRWEDNFKIIGKCPLGRPERMWELDVTSSGTSLMVGFGISVVEPFGCAMTIFFSLFTYAWLVYLIQVQRKGEEGAKLQ
jgi:hypothetical protein